MQITDAQGYRHRFFYVNTDRTLNTIIDVGDEIGYVQGLLDVFDGITDHYHYEILHATRRESVNPAEF